MIEKLKAVAHPVRLQIINILMDGELSVGDIMRLVGTKQTITSRHLTVMKSQKVLKSRRDGRMIYYSLENSGIKNIMAAFIDETE